MDAMSFGSRPRYSPWGEIQDCDEIFPGMFKVETAGHGGIMVQRDAAMRELSAAARRCGMAHGEYLCFEEDADFAVVFHELLARPDFHVPDGYACTRAEFAASIERSLARWHPEYLAAHRAQMARKARGGPPKPPRAAER